MLKFPEYANKCIDIIISNGFEAYFVGGCVRDGLLGRKCDDIDITTSAKPEDIIKLFPHTIPTGIKHGTVTVIIDDHPIEVTTYRQEFGYNDSRHPDNVVFVSDLQADLSRRDFTINALACSKNGEIIDMFGGLDDLQLGIIRAVGNPEKRFDEDALRIIRAYRFASVLDFKIEENTKNAALKLANKITAISGERILEELKKSSSGRQPALICELISKSVFTKFGIYSQIFSNEIFDRLSLVDIAPSFLLAILISMCKHDTKLITENLKPDHTLLNIIKVLDEYSTAEIPSSKAEIRMMLFKHHILYIRMYFYYLFVTNKVTDKSLFELLDEILDNREPYRVSHLEIDGNDMMNIGFKGAEIKKNLEKALFAVIDGKVENSRESLLNYLKN